MDDAKRRTAGRWALVGVPVAWIATVAVAWLTDQPWYLPPREGTGPFPSRTGSDLVMVALAGLPFAAGVLIWLISRRDDDAEVYIGPIAALIACFLAGVGVAIPIINSAHDVRATITDAGFPAGGLSSLTGHPLTFYNARREPVTVCLGTDGRCAGDSSGPAALRGDGLLIPPGRRVDAGTTDVEAVFRLTLAGLGPEVRGRNTELTFTSGSTE